METTPIQSENKRKTKSLVKWALILGIIVVLNLFFNYSISLIYNEPTFEEFCTPEITTKAYTDKEMCVSAGGQWNESTVPIEIEKTRPVPTQKALEVSGYCNPTYTCGQLYDDARSVYNRNVFIVLVILGIGSLVLGASILGLSVVSLGFSFGGVVSLLIGSARYWSDMNDILRVVVLALALGALIWLGVKKIKD